MESAFSAGNMLAVARFYADDAKLMGARGFDIQGRAAIDGYWSGIRSSKSWRLEVLELGVAASR